MVGRLKDGMSIKRPKTWQDTLAKSVRLAFLILRHIPSSMPRALSLAIAVLTRADVLIDDLSNIYDFSRERDQRSESPTDQPTDEQSLL